MALMVDARGLACPQPVILTNKAFGESDKITTIVDSEVAKENISRLAKIKGFRVEVEEKDGAIYLHLTREATEAEQPPGKAVSGPTVLLLASDAFGRGTEELGRLLMRSFLHTLGEVSLSPDQIIFVNSGVKLVVEGSEVLDDLRALEAQGTEILACGTCLGYYEIKDKVAVGQISNMYDIASALLGAGKIVAL
ncbi:MAG: sulfurtransferase-like selenium metabolism protein YedF [Dehalococcoidia bacterium]